MLKRIQTIGIAVALTAATGYAATQLLSEDFETGQVVGQQPTGASNVRPLGGNMPDAFVKVVAGTTNAAGTGNGVQMYDDTDLSFSALEYNFVNSAAEQLSLVRADFNVAWTGSSVSNDYYLNVGFGAFSEDLTLNGKTNRWNEMRLFEDGTLSFSGASSGDKAVTNGSHSITLFANDLPDPVYYVGLDGSTNKVNGDSIACWLDSTLAANVSLDLADYDIGITTNNFGKFGFSTGTSAIRLDYVFDDLVISTYDTVYVPPELVPDNILYVTFSDDIVGSQPLASTPAALIRPSDPTQVNVFTEVVGPADNPMGTGNAVELYDNSTDAANPGCSLEFNFVDSLAEQVSAVRVDFDFAFVATNALFNKPCHFGLGIYNLERTLNSSSRRFTDIRFYPDGTVDFRRNEPPGSDPGDPSNVMTNYPDSQNHPIVLGEANEISMFVNDYDSQTVDYTGLDRQNYTLPPNTIGYWLNGELVLMMDDNETNEYIIMDWFDVPEDGGFPPDDIQSSENNLGKCGFYTETSTTNLYIVVDSILVSTNLLFVVDSYEKWLSIYPEIGVQTNYTDDVEPDGMNNLLEFALGADPTTNDAALYMPTSHLAEDGGTKYLNYVYNRRDNAGDCDLTYAVKAGSDLITGLPFPTQELTPAGVGDLGFEVVTNRIPTTAADAAFMRLDVTITD